MKRPTSNLKKVAFAFFVIIAFYFSVQAQARSYTIQIASPPSESEARTMVDELKAEGIKAYWIKAEVPGKGARYRVRIGRFKTQAQAQSVASQAATQGLIKEFIVTGYDSAPFDRIAHQELIPTIVAEAEAAKEEPPEKQTSPQPSQVLPIAPESLAVIKPATARPATARPATAKPTETTNPSLPLTLSPPRPGESVKANQPEPSTRQPVEAATESRAENRNPAFPEIAQLPANKAPTETPKNSSETMNAMPNVAEATMDVAISNEHWKVRQRGLETDKNLRAIYFVDSMTGWTAGDAGAVYRTTDGGRSWKPLLSGSPTNINFIYFIDWNHGWMLGEASGREEDGETVLLMTINGGKTWTRKPMVNVLSLYFTDAQNGWAVGRNAALLKTLDGGLTWEKVEVMEKLVGLPIESSTYNYGFRDIQFIDSKRGWLIGNFYGLARSNIGGVFMTEDGGASWKRVPITIQTQYSSGRFTPGVFHSVKFIDQNTGSVTGEMYDGEGRFFFVLHTRDGGKTWEQFRTPSRATHNTQFLDLFNGWTAAFAPREGAAEAVVYDTMLMRTDNGGMSWRNDFIAKGRRIRGVFFLSPGNGWAVGDRGLILRYEDKSKAN